MCGIWGFEGGIPDVNVLMRTVQMAEDRGGHSNGFFGIRPDGSQVLVKAVMSDAEDLMLVAGECIIGVGHARLATDGDVNILNAQPIVTHDMIVVHNGLVHQHQKVMAHYGYVPHTELDSEALIPMIRAGQSHLPGAGIFIALDGYSHSLHAWNTSLPLHTKLHREVKYYCSKPWQETT